MTVIELIEALATFPPDMDVHISEPEWGSSPVGEVGAATVRVDDFAERVLPDGTRYLARLRKPREVEAVLIAGVT